VPEGPEIRRAADQLAAVLAGRRVERVKLALPKLKPWQSRLEGQVISQVRNHGKAMLTQFEHGFTLYSHNQLYGIWQIFPLDQIPVSSRSERVVLHTEEHSVVLYSASDITVLPTDQLYEHPFLAKLGPEVLDESLHWRELRDRFQAPAFRNRQFTSLLLDQTFLAGLGNYLRSEILFDAGVHPWHRPEALSDTVLGKLARTTLKLCQRSYKTGGITNSPSGVRKLRRLSSAFEDYRFAVFNREDQACIRCGDIIQRTEAGSRRLYWCPDCQKG